MIGHHEIGIDHRGLQAEVGHDLGDVLGDRADPRGLLRVGAVLAQHEAVVLDRGAAARGVDHDGIEPGAVELAAPGVDAGARLAQRRMLLAHVMGERAAAAGPSGDHHLGAVPGQQADGRLVDLRRQHLLGAAARAARRAPVACPRRETPAGTSTGDGDARRRGARPSIARSRPPSPRRGRRPAKGRASLGADQGQAEQHRARQHGREHGAQQPVAGAPAVGLLDMAAGMVDQMHVVHVGRAGRHAGEAGEAAVDVLDDLRARRPVVLEHVLDQVDAAARAVELVAEQDVGRAGRGAEAAVHAAAQDLLRTRRRPAG